MVVSKLMPFYWGVVLKRVHEDYWRFHEARSLSRAW